MDAELRVDAPDAPDAEDDTVASEGFCIECEGVQSSSLTLSLFLPDKGKINRPSFHVRNATMSSVRFAITSSIARVEGRSTRAHSWPMAKPSQDPRRSLMVQTVLRR